MKPLKIIIAGGGTGGHLFPGIAIAQAFTEVNALTRVLFVNSGNLFEKKTLAESGFAHQIIAVEGIKGRGLRKQMGAALKIPLSILQSWRIICRFNPDLVIGVGGYSAGPVVAAAFLSKIPTALHEQNILPGITNRILFYLVNRIYLSYKNTLAFKNTKAGKRSKKKLVTGNPLRKDIISAVKNAESDQKKTFEQNIFTILILGGSQGAHRINTGVAEALSFLKPAPRFCFIHQTGQHDLKMVQKAYQAVKISSSVQAFFNDMGVQYEKADLIICRAGATTVAEVTAFGKGVIFIPFPYAADNHQELNAEALVNAKGAQMILEKDLNGHLLAQRIMELADNPEKIRNMGLAAKKLGHPLAAQTIIEDCYALLSQKAGSKSRLKKKLPPETEIN